MIEILRDYILDYEPEAKTLRADIKQAYENARLNQVTDFGFNPSKYFISLRTEKFLSYVLSEHAEDTESFNSVFLEAVKVAS